MMSAIFLPAKLNPEAGEAELPAVLSVFAHAASKLPAIVMIKSKLKMRFLLIFHFSSCIDLELLAYLDPSF
jgi:hypothetical protein